MPVTQYRVITTILLLTTLAVACDSGNGARTAAALAPPTPAPAPESSAPIPRLSDGPHLGLIVGFDALDDDRQRRTETLLEANAAAGAAISRAQIDWGELEPAPGVYDEARLMAAMDVVISRQQQPFLTLSTLDSGGLTFPADLLTENRGLVGGMAIDDPEIVQRLEAFLAWLVPLLADYGVWGLAIANEPSSNFEAFGQGGITRLLTAGAETVQRLDQSLAVTVTFVGDTEDGSAVEQFIRDLQPVLDILSFNFYCLTPDIVTTGRERWETDLETFIGRARGKPVFFQELGCPTGWADTEGDASDRAAEINATPERQAEFFQYMTEQLAERPELRAATIFQLYDWSPGLVDDFVAPLRDLDEPGIELTILRLAEWLGSSGMCRWSTGNCREAWDIYLTGVERLAELRDDL